MNKMSKVTHNNRNNDKQTVITELNKTQRELGDEGKKGAR